MTDHELVLPDGRDVSVWEGGDPDGIPVLFFHGCPDSRRAAVSGNAAAARQGVWLVAASRPGYSTTTVPGPLTGGEHLAVADDTVAVADLMGIGAFAALGMSVGGPYALATAARHPGRVSAVGVVAAPADVPRLEPPVHRDGLDEDEREFFMRLATTPAVAAAEQMRPDFEAWVRGLDPDDSDDHALAERWLGILTDADRRLVEDLGPAARAAAAREAVGNPDGYLRDAAISFRAWAFDVADLRCPVFAWYGIDDPNYSVRNGEWLAAHVVATLTLREGASHLGTLVEHWDDMLATLRASRRTP